MQGCSCWICLLFHGGQKRGRCEVKEKVHYQLCSRVEVRKKGTRVNGMHLWDKENAGSKRYMVCCYGHEE